MAYTTLQLINRAFYLSQIVSRSLETVSAEQISDGLFLLNALIDFKNTDLRLIPYFKRYEFNAIQGEEEYFIENLLYVDALTFNIGPVRYQMYDRTRKEYFAGPRVDNIQALPFNYRCERELGGMRIFLYFLPESNYVMNLSGKFGLPEVTLNEDLSLVYDQYYIEYMRYALGRKICSEYGATFPDAAERDFQEMQKKMMDVEPPDLSITKTSYFSGQIGYDWQNINISPGYSPL